MTRSSAIVWASFAAILGAGALIYLIASVSPYLEDGSLKLPSLLGFFGAALLFLSGVGAIVALAVHERVPLLAGVTRRQPGATPAPEAAIRQGILFAFAICVTLLLSMFGLLDPAFALVALLIAALIEAVWQSLPGLRHD